MCAGTTATVLALQSNFTGVRGSQFDSVLDPTVLVCQCESVRVCQRERAPVCQSEGVRVCQFVAVHVCQSD